MSSRKTINSVTLICFSIHMCVTPKQISKPTISMPNSVSQKAGFYDDEPHPGGNKENEKTDKPGGNDAKKPVAGKGTIGVSGPNSSGWFGGIFNKFSLKPKNQMILPDDKNPSVSFDERCAI
jgi:COPII coat assembly protein SEC16